MTLIMAMLCNVPCVATGMGAQGEVIGQHGIAVEPGSPSAFIKAISRIMQMPEERRAAMTKGARKHALKNFVQVQSLQKYLQLYQELAGRQSAAAVESDAREDAASTPAAALATALTPAVAATPLAVLPQAVAPAIPSPSSTSSPVKAAEATRREAPAKRTAASASLSAVRISPAKLKSNSVSIAELADPDSLETQTSEVTTRNHKPDQGVDVLVSFESSLANSTSSYDAPRDERARGVADELEDLLSPEELHAPPVPMTCAAKTSESQSSNEAASGAVKESANLPVQLELMPEPEVRKRAVGDQN
jgi:hypothetical protein